MCWFGAESLSSVRRIRYRGYGLSSIGLLQSGQLWLMLMGVHSIRRVWDCGKGDV